MIEVALPVEAWQDVEPDTQALLDEWLVERGDRVTAGQALAKVVLVKANLELAAPADGIVEQILVPVEETFKRGQPLVLLRDTA
ncbi:MAG TPA: lipoyl domain-containing protein [Burkholderiaceae bacterium]|nr:lipoyl domain-containing protein [Burkholderiaceae bacterium]